MKNVETISRKHRYTIVDGESGFSLGVSGMNFTENDLKDMSDKFESAHQEMQKIESGEIKNPDENRKVTHFTDRTIYSGSKLFIEVEEFAEELRSGKIVGSTGKKFDSVIVNGIGGSALGPQLMQFAVNGPYWNEFSSEKRNGYLKIYFLDNTDTAGIADLAEVLDLETALIANISKSGGTQETKNNMISLENIYKKAGLDFTKHACAITMRGSSLDDMARGDKWLKVFEMAESIGGRTSETSIVGHLPAALTGVNFKKFLNGACHMDNLTRKSDYSRNPAYMLSAMWYIAGGGKGDRNMVIVPYSDRLILLSRYFQQLVMESLGKEKDLDGNIVHQGINVFGNKGGTDAHAFIQQLNDGRDDFFVTFIEVMKDRMELPIADGVSMGDYLHAFQAGLSGALRSKKRQVIQICIDEVNEFNLGMIIALYERAVAVYAEFIHINAFHQPGVQAYKLTSKDIVSLLQTLQKKLPEIAGFSGTSAEIAAKLSMQEKECDIDGILAKFSENYDKRDLPGFAVKREWSDEQGWTYSIIGR
jgi:glucose-6-phosphate isomerase